MSPDLIAVALVSLIGTMSIGALLKVSLEWWLRHATRSITSSTQTIHDRLEQRRAQVAREQAEARRWSTWAADNDMPVSAAVWRDLGQAS